MKEKCILSIDAGGTSFKYNILDFESLDPLEEEVFIPLPGDNCKDKMLSLFRDIFVDAINKSKLINREISNVAFSVPGPFDCRLGVSHMSHKWPSLKEVPLVSEFLNFGLFSNEIPYSFVHDVHAFLLGEKVFGKAKAKNRVAAVVIGTGVGFGMWDGEGFIVDETGHPKCGIYKYPYMDGILEDYVSGRALSYSYKQKTNINVSAKELADLARKGDDIAKKCFCELGMNLGNVLADILIEYNMEALIVGGRISLAFDLFSDSLEKQLRSNKCDTIVYQSELLESAAIRGAAAWAKGNTNNARKKVYEIF